MASRAPTLVKPKAKSTVTAKKITAKSSPSASKTVNKIAKALPAKSIPAPKAAAAPLKATTLKATTLKAAALKSTAVKTVAAVAKPATKTKAVKAVASPTGQITVKHAGHKPAATKPKSNSTEDSAKMTGTASFEPAAPKPRRRAKGEVRTRIYWAVFNQALRRVAVFEFDQREEAEKRAAKLALASGEHHFIQKIKALVQA